MNFSHGRTAVQKLQHAHAQYIESLYAQAMRLPGNPQEIEMIQIGGTKVFLSNKSRLENRAIFTGNETWEELQEITAIFDRKSVDSFFEINPANFYRSEPPSWKSEMVPALLELGYFPDDFRCVWYLDEFPRVVQKSELPRIKKFSSREADEYIQAKLSVEPVEKEIIEQEARMIKHHFTTDWTNFIGYEGEKAVSISRLFSHDRCHFLAWGYTQDRYRRKGHHRAHVLARVKHAFDIGCETIFTVTDFNVPSSFSLQKVGFKLAYNYLLMTRRVSNRP